MSLLNGFKRLFSAAPAPAAAPAPSPTQQLAQAVNADDVVAVANLLQQGADPNAPDPVHEWTALQRAAANGRGQALALLLEMGGNRHCVTDLGHTLLHLAANGMVPGVFAQLIDAGLDVNARDVMGQTPLFIAARLNDAAGVQRLLELGADPALTDATGLTALDHARARETDPVMAWSTAEAQQLLREALSA